MSGAELKTWFRGYLLALIPYAVLIVAFHYGIVCWLHDEQLGLSFKLRGPRVPSAVTVVRVDNRSFSKLGLPITTETQTKLLAEALEKINACGPKLVVLDYFFGGLTSDEQLNERFIRAVSSGPTLVGRTIARYTDTDLSGKQTVTVEHQRSVEPIVQAAKWSVPHMVRHTGGSVTSIALGSGDSDIPLEPFPFIQPLRQLVSGKLQAPGPYDLINYYGGPYSVPDVPIYQLTGDSPVPTEYFKDRVVAIGVVNFSPGGVDRDVHPTPTSIEPMPGVEIIATVINNIIDGSWIRRGEAPLVDGVIYFVVMVFFYELSKRCGLLQSLIACLTFSAVWTTAAYAAFMWFSFFLPVGEVVFIFMPTFLLTRSLFDVFRLRKRLQVLEAMAGSSFIPASAGVLPMPLADRPAHVPSEDRMGK